MDKKTYGELAFMFGLTERQLKRIVRKGEQTIFRHIK